jgi:ABC-2 type transport system permease protein
MSKPMPMPMPAPAPARELNVVDRQPQRALHVAAKPTVSAGFAACGALVLRSLSRSRGPALAVCLILATLQVVLVLEASAQQQAQSFSRLAEMLPAFLRRTLGDLTLIAVSFQGAVCAGYFHPVIVLLVSFVGIFFGSEPAADVDTGTVDLVLARPLPRHWLITRSLALIVLGTGGAPLVMAMTMWAALLLLAPADAPWPVAASVLKMALNLTAVATTIGMTSLAVASFARRRGTPIAAAGTIMLAVYLVNFLEPTWAPAQAIGWLSPFHYFHPLTILAGRSTPWRDLLILSSASAALAAVAYWQFNRRDL